MRVCHTKISRNGVQHANIQRLPLNSTRLWREAALSTFGAIILDDVGQVRYCSAITANIFGGHQQNLVGLHISVLIQDFPPGRQSGGEKEGVFECLETSSRWQVCRGICLDGRVFPIEVRMKRPGLSKCHQLLLRVPYLPRQRNQSESLTRLKLRAEESEHAVMITTEKAIITYVNPAFEALTGFACDELRGQNAAIFNAGTHDQRLFEYDCLWSALRVSKDGKEFPYCFVNRKKDGDFFFMEQIIRPFVASNGTITHYVFTSRDISERVMAVRHLAQQANYDNLTGLANRGLFLDRLHHTLSQAARRKERFALLYIDLDNLKVVNDTYGHAAGDVLLRTTAMRLRQSVREGDTVARLGGDEFALILADAKKRDDVEKVIEKIFEVFNEGVVIESRRLAIRASVGVSLYPENGADCDQIIERADQAMFKKKAAGGNGACFFVT